MADNSKIEWTDATWNPVVGCSKVSAGCEHCYAERMAARLARMGKLAHYRDVAYGGEWTGRIGIADDAVWEQPMRWKRPRVIFVCSMGDLFHSWIPSDAKSTSAFSAIDRVLMTAAAAPRHQFVLLTKRVGQAFMQLSPMRDVKTVAEGLGNLADRYYGEACACQVGTRICAEWPLRNVWIGATMENQAVVAQRIEPLLCIGDMGWRIWVSCEPLLGPVFWDGLYPDTSWSRFSGVVVGGESGPGARPMHPDWARGIRDHCAQTGKLFFFKQWGEWLSGCFFTDTIHAHDEQNPELGSRFPCMDWDEYGKAFETDSSWMDDLSEHAVYRVGKKMAGRLLDGREHNDLPWRMQAS